MMIAKRPTCAAMLAVISTLSADAASVILDNAQSLGLDSAASRSIPGFTVANQSNRVLVVTINGEFTRDISSVSYGTQSLTNIGTEIASVGPSTVSLWYLLAPAVGTENITVNFAGTGGNMNGYAVGALSFYNVAQSAPIDYQATSKDGGTSNLAYTIGTDAVIVEGLEINNGGGIPAPGSGQTQYFSDSDTNSYGARVSGLYEITGSGNQSNSFGTISSRFAYAGAVFAAVPEPSHSLLCLGGFAAIALRRRRA